MATTRIDQEICANLYGGYGCQTEAEKEPHGIPFGILRIQKGSTKASVLAEIEKIQTLCRQIYPNAECDADCQIEKLKQKIKPQSP